MSDRDIAVVHEAAFTRGGGIRVVEEAAQRFSADLYIGMVEEDVRRHSPLEISPLFDRTIKHGTLRGLYFLSQFRNISRIRDYDVVLLSGSGTHWYHPPPGQRLVWYVHSIPLSYKQDSLTARLSTYLRQFTLSAPDAVLANSEPTQSDILEYWGQDSSIAFPPIDVDSFDSSNVNSNHHLSISRLTANKGMRELVKVYNRRDEDLIVVGDGPLLEELCERAEENVHIVGYVSEERKRTLLSEAAALVLNSGNESFGIVPIEAMASGTPVIAKNGGYTPFQIQDGYTGLLYDDGQLAATLDRFAAQGVTATSEQLASAARKYGIDQFVTRLEEALLAQAQY